MLLDRYSPTPYHYATPKVGYLLPVKCPPSGLSPLHVWARWRGYNAVQNIAEKFNCLSRMRVRHKQITDDRCRRNCDACRRTAEKSLKGKSCRKRLLFICCWQIRRTNLIQQIWPWNGTYLAWQSALYWNRGLHWRLSSQWLGFTRLQS